MKALFTAAAALALAASATAGTISFSNYSHQDATGFGAQFEDIYNFSLADTTWVRGLMSTSALLGGDPAVDIQSVLLRHVGSTVGWTETIAIDWDVAEGGVEQWGLTPRQLAAGAWQLEISGISYADKAGNGYSASLELPEPGSVALAALALVGAGVGSLRRRKA